MFNKYVYITWFDLHFNFMSHIMDYYTHITDKKTEAQKG